MKQVRYRWFWAWDFDREEEWLNAWAAEGQALVDASGIRYVFEESAPGAYEYRLELLEHTPGNPESVRYLQFLEETGIECVGTFGRWAYLRRRSDGAPFSLFSDIDSKIAHLQRVKTLVLAVLVMQLAGAANLLMRLDHARDMLPIAVVWAVVVALVAYGFARIARKVGRLKREREVWE